MKSADTVDRYMSRSPHTIGRDQPLSRAHAVMREHAIRHLPVLHGGQLVGILSLRDLHLLESLGGVDQDRVTVEEAMTDDVYSVEGDTPIDEVASILRARKYGCAIVTEKGRVVGVFTTIDALHALVEFIDGKSPRREAETRNPMSNRK